MKSKEELFTRLYRFTEGESTEDKARQTLQAMKKLNLLNEKYKFSKGYSRGTTGSLLEFCSYQVGSLSKELMGMLLEKGADPLDGLRLEWSPIWKVLETAEYNIPTPTVNLRISAVEQMIRHIIETNPKKEGEGWCGWHEKIESSLADLKDRQKSSTALKESHTLWKAYVESRALNEEAQETDNKRGLKRL